MQIDLTQDQAMISAARRRTRRTPWLQLLSALLELGQGKTELLRHSVVLAFTGEEAVAAGETLIDGLPDHEFSIPRQLVADAAVVRVDHTALPQPRLEVEVEVLMLDEV